MKRIYLTGATARLLEQQMSVYEDARDEKGKALREPKERRQWNRIAEAFDAVTEELESKIQALRDQGSKWGQEVLKSRSQVLEDLVEEWQRNHTDPADIHLATDGIKSAFQMRIDAKEAELSLQMQDLEDGPLGKAPCEIDLDDTQVDFLVKTWPELDLNTNKKIRKMVNFIEDALKDAVELIKEGDNYIPRSRKPVLLESEKAG